MPAGHRHQGPSFFRAAVPASSCAPVVTAEYTSRLKLRAQLPIWEVHADVMHCVKNNRVVVIAGETGCGKSTQVPQMLLADPALSSTCRIVVTQV